jgi:hypothetical protein
VAAARRARPGDGLAATPQEMGVAEEQGSGIEGDWERETRRDSRKETRQYWGEAQWRLGDSWIVAIFVPPW